MTDIKRREEKTKGGEEKQRGRLLGGWSPQRQRGLQGSFKRLMLNI